MFIDSHMHVASTKFIPRAFFEGIVDNILSGVLAMTGERRASDLTRSQILDNILGAYQDHSGEFLYGELVNAGVDKAVILMPDFTYALQSELTIYEQYEQKAEILKRFKDRFIVFAGVDPRWGKDALELFEKGIVDFGFSGFKMYPPCGYSPSDPMLDPFYEYCAEKQLPVLIHFGPTSPVLSFEYANPLCLDRAAKRFSNVNFIIAHGAVHYREEAIAMCRYRPNVYLDVSAFTTIEGGAGWKPVIKKMLDSDINHKVLFGSDWPLTNFSSDYRSLIDYFKRKDQVLEGLKTVDYENFIGGNISRLLPPGKQ